LTAAFCPDFPMSRCTMCNVQRVQPHNRRAFADVNYVVVGIWILDFIGVANPSTHRVELLSL